MANKSTAWKPWEGLVSKLLGGDGRRGPKTGDEENKHSDIMHPYLAVECKLYSRIGFAKMLAAAIQAEESVEARDEGKEPIAVIKIKGAKWQNALVVQRLETYLDWHGPDNIDRAECIACGYDGKFQISDAD